MHLSESEILDRAIRAAAGEPRMLETLLQAHRAAVISYIEHCLPSSLRNIVDPQDILQDTFFEAFRRIEKFSPDGPSSFQRWLVTIARTKIIDVGRRQRALKRGGNSASITPASEPEDATMAFLLQDLALCLRTPSQSAISHELAENLNRAIAKLDPDYKSALQLRYLQGMSPAEAAHQMERSEGALLMLCNRALKALRVEMKSMSLYF